MSAEDFGKLIFEPGIQVSCLRETAASELVGGLNLSISMHGFCVHAALELESTVSS